MPPYYPEQYQNQYPNQYSYGTPYNVQYNQYQYGSAPQSQPQAQNQSPTHAQPIAPFSQIQVNIPPRQSQNLQTFHNLHNQPNLQSHINYNPSFQQDFVQNAQLQYQYQQQSPYMPQQHLLDQRHIQHQHFQQQQSQHLDLHQHQQQQARLISQSQSQPQAQSKPSPQPLPLSQLQPPPQQQPSPQLQMQSNQYHQQTPPYKPPSQQIQVNVPKVQLQHQTSSRVLKDALPTTPRQQQNAPKPPTPKQAPEPPEPNYAMVLLSLADEYLEAAQKLPVRSESYFKLTALALGCIDAALNNFKLPPLREAQVSLKYAQLLFSETENNDDAERILSKTIEQCDRLKYHDLKYAAQLLLIRVLHQSRPKAGLKDLQGMIQDIEAYRHTAWEYAFRLQYVMFAMASSQPNDAHTAITQLERICHVARQNGDHAVLAFAAVLEALIHLQANSLESKQSSQRALAKARALQLNPDVEGNPQICIMMEFVDLCAQIKDSDVLQGEKKRKEMQSVLYPALQKSSWRNDGLVYIPLSPASLRGLQVQDSGLIAYRNERYYLAFSWLLKDEVEDLGYLLSGVSAARKNAGDGGKAEKFLHEGLVMIQELQDEKRSTDGTGDAVRARQQLVQCHFLIETAFLQCSKGQWGKAQASIKSIDSVMNRLEVHLPTELRCLVEYVKGAIQQGKGNLDTALRIFQSPGLNILSYMESQAMTKPSNQLHRNDEVVRNVAVIAGMNTIFIIQQPNHPQHHRLSTLLATLDPLASQHTNKNIQAAWNFVLACLPNNTTLKTKQHLGSALSAAQSINNAQITTLCLVTMQEKFFKGIMGEQAIKCARAASHQAKRLDEPKWIATASGLEAECLGVHGMLEEGRKKREEMEQAMELLPERVKQEALRA